jgi:transcription antitermination protein NusB
MELSPQKQREISVQLLYLLNEMDDIPLDSIKYFMSLFNLTKKKMIPLIRRAKEIFEKKELSDRNLEEASLDYAFDRISKVDLAILRVVLFELFNDIIPVEIAISEAIRVAKKFSSYGSGKYLHAMIDSIYKEAKHDQKATV